MAQPTLQDRLRVNHELKRLGFGGLDDPKLLDQLAFFIRSHEQFRGILMSAAPDQRRLAYESLAGRLRFAPKPLDVYEREAKERAEREQWDIWDGSAYPKPFKPGEVESEEYKLARLAEEAIEDAAHEKANGVLEVCCSKCTIASYFSAPKRKAAVKAAYDAGWRWEERNGAKRTFCPDHVPGRCTMALECGACPRKARIRVWDEQDGYRDARRLGWEFTDAGTKCPRCAAKLVLVQ
jgi:hypothetical protein